MGAFIVGVILLWVVLGWLLTWLGARPRRDKSGTTFVSIENPVVQLGELANLTIYATPPAPAVSTSPPAQDVIFVLDRSPSMGAGAGSALDEMMRAACEFLSGMPDNFRSGVVAFDEGAQIVSPVSADHSRSVAAVKSLTSGDGTSIAAGLRKAKSALDALTDRRPTTVVLLTDGEDPNPADARSAIASLHETHANVTVAAIALGPDADAALLDEIVGGASRAFRLGRPEEIRSMFDFLSGQLRGGAPATVVMECEIQEPAPWCLAIDGEFPTFSEARASGRLTARWVRPVLGSEPFVFRVPLEARCPGWWPVLARCRVEWHFDAGPVEHFEVSPGPRALVLPRWLEGTYPLANALLAPFLHRLGCLHEEAVGATGTVEPLAPRSFDALGTPGQRPYSPSAAPTLFVCLGAEGRKVGDALAARIYDRDIDPAIAPRVYVHVGEKPAGEESTPYSVNLAVDAREWVRNAAAQGVPPTRAFVPAAEWLASGEVLHTHFGVGRNRALARLALLLQPQELQAAIDSAVGAPRPTPLEKIVLVASADDPGAGALLIEVAHLCAPLSLPCFVVLAASRRLANQRGPEEALAAELDRVVSCRDELVVSDRGGVETAARRFLDAVIVVGDRHALPDESLASHVDAVWTLFAYPELKPFVDREIAGGSASMRIVARSAPRRRLWEMVRERALGDILTSWITDNEDPAAAWAAASSRADALVGAFWSGGTGMPPFPPRFRAIAAPHLSRGSGVTGAAAPPARSEEREAEAPFTDYVEAWLRHEFSREEAKGWDVAPAMLALRKIEAQLQESAVAYANVTEAGQRGISGLALRYRQVVTRLIAHLSQWHEAMTGLAWPLESSAGFDSGLCADARHRAAVLHESIVTALPPASERLVEAKYRDWIAVRLTAVLKSLGLWAVRGANGEIAIEILGPENRRAALADAGHSIREWLDVLSREVMGWTDDAAMIPFTGQPGALSIGARAHDLGGREPPPGLRADPAFAASIDLSPLSIHHALGVSDTDSDSRVPVWPEETHAARISALFGNAMGVSRLRLTGQAVSVLRDPRRALSFLAAIRDGRIVPRAGRLMEASNDLGPAFEGQEAVIRFARALRTAPSVESWPAVPEGPDGFVAALEATGAFHILRISPEWDLWRDVIRGLVLDAEARSARAAVG
jgi:uncharacterized protein YegL